MLHPLALMRFQPLKLGHGVTVLTGEDDVLDFLNTYVNALPNLPKMCPNRHGLRYVITRSGKRVCAACQPRASLT